MPWLRRTLLVRTWLAAGLVPPPVDQRKDARLKRGDGADEEREGEGEHHVGREQVERALPRRPRHKDKLAAGHRARHRLGRHVDVINDVIEMAAVTAWRRWAGDAAAAAPEATVPSGPGGSPTTWYLPRRLFYPRNGGDPPLRLGQAVLGVVQGDGRPQALVCRAWPWPAAAHYDAVASCPPETVVLGDAGPWLADAADARDGGSGAPPSLVVYVPPATLASSICVRSASPGTTVDDRVAAVVQQQLQGLFLAPHALLTVSVPGQGPTTCEVSRQMWLGAASC